jgi:hypothetical protein
VLPAFLLTSCSSPKQSESVELLSAERLINKLEANRRKIRSFEGTGSIYVKTPAFDNGASFRIVVQKPDSIYLSIFGPFGLELAQILVSKNNFTFYEAMHNTAYTGKLTDDILKEIFKIDLPLSELIDAFTGAVNFSTRLYKEPTLFTVVEDKYILTYVDSTAQTITRYTIDVKDLSIIATRIEDFKGNPLMESDYSSFVILETISAPQNILMKQESKRQSLNIEYSKINANRRNIKIDFSIPENADIIKWKD